MPDFANTARHEFKSLLAGHPNGATPESIGPWWQPFDLLRTELETRGKAAMYEAWEMLGKTPEGRKLHALVASDSPRAPAQTRGACPPLPATAAAVLEHAAPCAAWLDDYIEYASQAAPMTPRSFHEAAALSLVSIAIARRLVLPVGITNIYPNLYILFMAPSTLYSKTTGFQIMQGVIEAAGLDHLLLPQRMPPEAFIAELGTSIPTSYYDWDDISRDTWLRERAFAAQRGWAIDEASSLFDGMKRDYNTGLLPLLLELYDCKDRKTDQTLGRGRSTIKNAYLSFFGAATPAAMAEHISSLEHWTNGLWARFVLIAPDQAPRFQFFPEHIAPPSALSRRLTEIYRHFAEPRVTITEGDDPRDKKKTRLRVEVDDLNPIHVTLADGVWRAWEAYTKAVRHDLLVDNLVDGSLHANYGRLGTMAIKVAMLLATMDAIKPNQVSIELRHLARAIEICERWRATLHTIWIDGAKSKEAQLSDKVLAMLAGAGPAGMPARDIYRPLGKTPEEIRAVLEELALAGMAEQYYVHGDQTKRRAERWKLCPAEDEMSKCRNV